MATTVDTLLVRIEADMSDLKQSLDKVQRDVDKSSKGIAGAFRKIGTAMKAAVAAVLVREAVRGGTAMINLASDIEEMQGKSKVVFGAFRDQVVSDLEAFGDAVGRSTFELEGMASSIQDTFVPMGFARGEAAKLSVELTKLAVDVASFNNASDTETMEAFQSALVGNHETVRRFGVIITQATLDQELMRMGIEKGTKTATEAEKVQARLNIITRGTSDAHGDAARTSTSFANQMRALKAEVGELAGELGEILLPAATSIISAFIEGTKRAKEFLQSMGILKMPIDKALVQTRAEIAATETELAKLQAGARPDDLSDSAINPALMGAAMQGGAAPESTQADLIAQTTARLEELRATRDGLISQQLDIVPPAITSGKAAEATAELSEEEKELKKTLEEQRNAMMTSGIQLSVNTLNQRRLNDAIREGNKEAELSARTDIILQDLKKQYPELAKNKIYLLKEEAKGRATVQMKTEAHATALEKVKEAQDNYQASAQSGLDYVLSNIRTNQELEETLKDLKAAYDAGKISVEEFKIAQGQIKEQIAELDPVYKRLKDQANDAFDSVADAMTEMVMKGKLDLDSLGNIFKQTIREMIADAVKAQVIKPLLSSAFGFIGSAIGGPVGNFIGGIGKAGGGDIDRPTLVGERGPELFVPHSAGTILNNHNTKNALGGGGGTAVYQTINVSAGVSQTVRAEMMSLLPRFKQDTMAAVVDAKRRGGSFGQAFG